ncbi:MAG: outer membrane protein assembly factor [Bacteroidales bacterium]|nr:outer membrane protein assembly factor [Bacteroidales bacterium]MCF8455666.1 outer membrane protein assembly factor [Bacteroidales bacterium]
MRFQQIICRSTYLKTLSLSIILLAKCNLGYSQLEKHDSLPNNFVILPVPTLGSSPETRFYFGAAVLFSFRSSNAQHSTLSSAKVEVTYTFNKQIIFDLGHYVFSNSKNYLFQGNNTIRYYPEKFYGIGRNTPELNELLYDYKLVDLDNSVFYNVRRELYVGINYRYNNIFDIHFSNELPFSTENIIGLDGGISSGFGYSLLLDRRDNLLNPSAGSFYFQIKQTYFNKNFGSSNEFSKFVFEAKGYFTSFIRQHIIAVQTYCVSTEGNVPFNMLALLGSDSHTRGYLKGRYRDKNYFSAQAEYRMPVWKWLGLVGFYGIGDVARSFSDISMEELKYSFGGGIRIRVSKADNINLRLDYAIGEGSSGFYISFGEAF